MFSSNLHYDILLNLVGLLTEERATPLQRFVEAWYGYRDKPGFSLQDMIDFLKELEATMTSMYHGGSVGNESTVCEAIGAYRALESGGRLFGQLVQVDPKLAKKVCRKRSKEKDPTPSGSPSVEASGKR